MPRIRRFGKRKFLSNQFSLTPSVSTSIGTPETRKEDAYPTTPSPSSNENEAGLKSTSSKKLLYLRLTAEDEEYLPKKCNTGNVIVDLSILNKMFQTKCNCNNPSLEVFELTKLRKGLASKLQLSCQNCKFTDTFMTSNQLISDENKPNTSRVYDINVRLAYGMRTIGKGQVAAEALCAIMNLPSPPKRFQSYNGMLSEATKSVAIDCMKNAAREAIIDNDGNTDICAAFDGSWQKRGHISKNGIVSVTNMVTGKVMDVECLSKYCHQCHLMKEKAHLCKSNYVGSSGGMELAGVEAIFKRSEAQNGVRYTQYLGDGDSKAFQHVVDCKPYGDEVELKKLECVGHIQKRMGARLRKMRAETKGKLKDGKSLSGKSRLTLNAIDELQTYYGLAIRRNVESLENMHDAVWATYYHKLSTDENPQHGLCPKGEASWCKYQRSLVTKEYYTHKNPLPDAVMTKIKPVYEDLSKKELLRKCLHGRTQNPNESFNNVVWSRIPKRVFVGLETLKIGTWDAVITYNTGFLGRIKVLQHMFGVAGANCVIGLKKLDKTRVRKADNKSVEMAKKARAANRNKKRNAVQLKLYTNDGKCPQ